MKKRKNKRNWRTYLSNEIGIEYKACLYFWVILFFYAVYLLYHKVYSASLLYLGEMILTTYLNSYLQVYIFQNFDEADKLGKKEWISICIYSMIYGVISYLLSWFDQNPVVTIIFVCYFIFVYVCVYLINKIKRDIDTEQLNDMLNEYKKGEHEQ